MVAGFGAWAQDGIPDATFGNDGTVRVDLQNDSRDIPIDIITNENGNIIVSGFTEINNENVAFVSRFLGNGLIDDTFGTNGFVVVDFDSPGLNTFNQILTLDDGSLLAARLFQYQNDYQLDLMKIKTSGEIDNLFGIDGLLTANSNVDGYFAKAVLLDDDSILTIAVELSNGDRKLRLRNFFSNGDINGSFGTNGVSDLNIGHPLNKIDRIATSNNGNQVLAVKIIENGSLKEALIRITSQGSLDGSFGDNGVVRLEIQEGYDVVDLAVFDDGKVAVLSQKYDFTNEVILKQISRYHEGGGLDMSFGDEGHIDFNPSGSYYYDLIVQQNQKLICYIGLEDFFEGGGPNILTRYNYDGTEDSTFQQQIIPGNFELFQSKAILDSEGKIVVLSYTPWYSGDEDIVLERYNNNPLSISDYELIQASVSPNPSNGIFKINFETLESKVEYKVYDVLGNRISKGVFSEMSEVIDLSQTQSGVYFLKIGSTAMRLLKN